MKYEVYWSGNKLKRQHGVGIAVKYSPRVEIIEVLPISARIIVLDVVVYGCELRVISCYAPTEDSSDSTKDSFYRSLRKQMTGIPTKRKVICLGDFNATTSAAWNNTSLRENVVVENLVTNNNGRRFHELFNSEKLSVLNTWFTHKRCRRVTWHAPNGMTKKVYDFVLACSWIRQYVTNCRAYNSYDFDSDHRLVIASLNTPGTKVARYVKRNEKVVKSTIDLKALNNNENANKFVNNAVSKIDIQQTDNNSVINEKLVGALKQAAEETLPKVEKAKLHQPWHNDKKLKDLYSRKEELMEGNHDQKAIAAVRKKIRLRARHLKNEHLRSEAQKINQLAINRELEKLFQKAKNQETTL